MKIGLRKPRVIFLAFLSVVFCSNSLAGNREDIINLSCDMSGEVSGVLSGQSYGWKIPRKVISVQIKQLYMNNDPNDIFTRIMSDDPSGELWFKVDDANPADNYSDDSKYHIKNTWEDTSEELVINRYTGSINYYSQRLRKNDLQTEKYSGTCKKHTQQQF